MKPMKLMTQALAIAATICATTTVRADVDLTLEELPAAVRATAEREVGDGIIDDVERDNKGGRVVYEVEFVLEGQEYELDIAEDGTLLRRHRD